MKAPAFLGDGFKLILNGEKYPRPAMLSALQFIDYGMRAVRSTRIEGNHLKLLRCFGTVFVTTGVDNGDVVCTNESAYQVRWLISGKERP